MDRKIEFQQEKSMQSASASSEVEQERKLYHVLDQIKPLPVVGWWQLAALYNSPWFNGNLRRALWNQRVNLEGWRFRAVQKLAETLIAKGEVIPFQNTWSGYIDRCCLSLKRIKDLSIGVNHLFIPVKGYPPLINEEIVAHNLIITSVLSTLQMCFGASLLERKEWRRFHDFIRYRTGLYPDGAFVLPGCEEFWALEVETDPHINHVERKMRSYAGRGNVLFVLKLKKESTLLKFVSRLEDSPHWYGVTIRAMMHDKNPRITNGVNRFLLSSSGLIPFSTGEQEESKVRGGESQ